MLVADHLRKKFDSRVLKTETCWLWTGPRYKNSKRPNERWHGVFHVPVEGTRATHRIAWMIAHGSIPRGMCVLHRCDVPDCVNPDHLFLGTQLDNIADMNAKGRHAKGYRLDEQDVRVIRQKITDGCLHAAIAEEFGVSRALISLIGGGKVGSRTLGPPAIQRNTHARGSKNGNARISKPIADEIRTWRGKISRNAIAAKFGVSKATVDRVLRGTCWI